MVPSFFQERGLRDEDPICLLQLNYHARIIGRLCRVPTGRNGDAGRGHFAGF